MKKLFLSILFCLISLFGLAQSFTGVTASGTDTYAITVSGSSYFTNQSFEVRFTNPNTGAATLTVTANDIVQAAKAITTDGSTPVTAGQLSGAKWLIYNGTNFQIVNNSSGGGGTPGGSTTQVQFNLVGAFAGNANFTINNGTGVVTFGQLPTIPVTPVASTDAASKGYVDGLSLGPFSTVAAGYTNLSGGATKLLQGDNTWIANTALPYVPITLTANTTVTGGGGTYDLKFGSTAGTEIKDFTVKAANTITLFNTTGTSIVMNSTVVSLTSVGQISVGAVGINVVLPSLTPSIGQALTASNTSGQLQWSSVVTNPMTSVGDLIQGTTAGAPARLADVAAGSYLRSGGVTTPVVWSTTTIPNTVAVGDLWQGTATNVVSVLASVATGNALLSGGVTTASSWGKITSAHIDATVQTAGLSWLLTGTSTFTGAVTIDQTTTSGNILKFLTPTLGVTPIDGKGLWIQNATAAAAGAQQISGSLLLEGQGWATTPVASQSVKWKIDNLPVQGAANPTTQLRFASSVNGSAYTTQGFFLSDGSLNLVSGGSLAFAGTGLVTVGAGSSLRLVASNAGAGVSLEAGATSSAGQWVTYINGGALTMTSGVNTMMMFRSANTFAPTSGTATYAGMIFNHVLNTTGTYSGTAYGIWYNPTLTSVTGLTHYGIIIAPAACLNGFGVTTPTALVHIAAGTATASTAPLKFNSGTNLTTAEAGAMEYNGTNLFFTPSGTTRKVVGLHNVSRVTAQNAANASVATWTVGANDGTFIVSANVLVTTATTHTFTVTCAYTDEGNTARTATMNFSLVAGGAITTSIANANGTVPYLGIPLHIRCKAATTITIATTGTFTTVTYNCEGNIMQIN